MRAAAVALCLVLLTGCAGLRTEWALQLQIRYLTPADPSDKPAPAKAPAI